MSDQPEPKPKGKVGRKSILTPLIHTTIVERVAAGNFLSVAAQSVGVGYSTVRNWIAIGNKSKKEPYHSFAKSIQKATAQAEIDAITDIKTAGKTQWQARAWYLERKFPERWSLDRELIKEFKAFLAERKKSELK